MSIRKIGVRLIAKDFTSIMRLRYLGIMEKFSLFGIPLLLFVLSACIDRGEEVDAYLDVKGNKIHYKTDGRGKELILVHGGYLDLAMWQPQVDELKWERSILRFSDVGHGSSVGTQPVLGFEIIEALTGATPDNPTTILGLSWGAMLCVDYAINYPDKVEKLILVSPGLNGWEYFQDTVARKNNQLRKIATRDDDIAKAAELFHQNWVVGPNRKGSQLDEDFYRWSLAMIQKNMQSHWKENWSDLDSIPARQRLGEIRIPTYIIIGDEDAEDIKMIARIYDEEIPNSSVIIMDSAGHLLTAEHPLKFNAVLKGILRE